MQRTKPLRLRELEPARRALQLGEDQPAAPDEHQVGEAGGVSLDRVVNRMLIVAAKTMGADKIVGLEFDVTPDGGVWSLR